MFISNLVSLINSSLNIFCLPSKGLEATGAPKFFLSSLYNISLPFPPKVLFSKMSVLLEMLEEYHNEYPYIFHLHSLFVSICQTRSLFFLFSLSPIEMHTYYIFIFTEWFASVMLTLSSWACIYLLRIKTFSYTTVRQYHS